MLVKYSTGSPPTSWGEDNVITLFKIIFCFHYTAVFKFLRCIRVVIKSGGQGIFPGYHECGPWLFLLENRRKIEPKEIPSCLIPRLLVVFTRQLEILVTTLMYGSSNAPSPFLTLYLWVKSKLIGLMYQCYFYALYIFLEVAQTLSVVFSSSYTLLGW